MDSSSLRHYNLHDASTSVRTLLLSPSQSAIYEAWSSQLGDEHDLYSLNIMFGLSEEFFLNHIEVNLENDSNEIEDKGNEKKTTIIQFWNPRGMKRGENDCDDDKKSQSSSSWKCRLWNPSKLSFHCMNININGDYHRFRLFAFCSRIG